MRQIAGLASVKENGKKPSCWDSVPFSSVGLSCCITFVFASPIQSEPCNDIMPGILPLRRESYLNATSWGFAVLGVLTSAKCLCCSGQVMAS